MWHRKGSPRGSRWLAGSIFGIWPGGTLLGRSGREQAAAAYGVYGSRTTLVVARPRSGDSQGILRAANVSRSCVPATSIALTATILSNEASTAGEGLLQTHGMSLMAAGLPCGTF